MMVGLFFLVIILLAGAMTERIASARDRRRFPPPGQMVDVGGRRLHLHCAGSGEGPTVVILPGRFNTSLMWNLVRSGAAQFARVCVYDRAGYAWSEPDPEPRSGLRVADELHVLLRRAEVPGPYLLVGHSLGVMYARLFAQRYPDEVVGLVLVDAYTEGEVRSQPPRLKAVQARAGRSLRILSFFGVLRLIAPLVKGSVAAQLRRFTPEERTRLSALTASSRLWRAVDREWQALDDLVDRLGGISQADIDRHWLVMKESQAALLHLSRRNWLKDLPATGHGVPVENPEAVVEAIREMMTVLAE